MYIKVQLFNSSGKTISSLFLRTIAGSFIIGSILTKSLEEECQHLFDISYPCAMCYPFINWKVNQYLLFNAHYMYNTLINKNSHPDNY